MEGYIEPQEADLINQAIYSKKERFRVEIRKKRVSSLLKQNRSNFRPITALQQPSQYETQTSESQQQYHQIQGQNPTSLSVTEDQSSISSNSTYSIQNTQPSHYFSSCKDTELVLQDLFIKFIECIENSEFDTIFSLLSHLSAFIESSNDYTIQKVVRSGILAILHDLLSAAVQETTRIPVVIIDVILDLICRMTLRGTPDENFSIFDIILKDTLLKFTKDSYQDNIIDSVLHLIGHVFIDDNGASEILMNQNIIYYLKEIFRFRQTSLLEQHEFLLTFSSTLRAVASYDYISPDQAQDLFEISTIIFMDAQHSESLYLSAQSLLELFSLNYRFSIKQSILTSLIERAISLILPSQTNLAQIEGKLKRVCINLIASTFTQIEEQFPKALLSKEKVMCLLSSCDHLLRGDTKLNNKNLIATVSLISNYLLLFIKFSSYSPFPNHESINYLQNENNDEPINLRSNSNENETIFSTTDFIALLLSSSVFFRIFDSNLSYENVSTLLSNILIQSSNNANLLNQLSQERHRILVIQTLTETLSKEVKKERNFEHEMYIIDALFQFLSGMQVVLGEHAIEPMLSFLESKCDLLSTLEDIQSLEVSKQQSEMIDAFIMTYFPS